VELEYGLVTLIEGRGDASVGVCAISLTKIGKVVGEVWGEVFATECNLRFF